jgi:hypothetical protein
MAALYFARLAFLAILLLVGGTLAALAVLADREKK